MSNTQDINTIIQVSKALIKSGVETKKELAEKLGIGQSTLYKRLRESKELREVLKDMSPGRNKIKIDYKIVDNLAGIQCTEEEIATVLGVSVKTLQRDEEFSRVYKSAITKGKKSLRRWQFETAKAGNPTMQIWLGKVYLGQRDPKDVRVSTPEGKKLEIETHNKFDDEFIAKTAAILAECGVFSAGTPDDVDAETK